MECPRCGANNPGRARFCLECGAELGDAAAPATGAQAGTDLPRGMLAKLQAARADRSMAGERRIVTMLFCDVVGSTAMAERLDPEEWTDTMNAVFAELIAPIYRYEGTLARLMGDAIFAFFGAPIAHEDDPRRAVSAGLEIVGAVAAGRDRFGELNVRVGINTGPVVVGEVGSDLRVEYTAMGDAVNVAARMEQTAEPGTVQITDETHRLVASYFETDPVGPVQVKGKVEPVIAHRVRGRRVPGAEPPPEARSPLVGRADELRTLRAAVDDVLAGRGRNVALIGEAGLGKSRLIDEVRGYWTERSPASAAGSPDVRRPWETWECVSYDTSRPYAQYRRMIAAIAGIAETDPPEVVRRKLARTIEPDAPEWLEPHMRIWRSLFGVTEPGEGALEGEAFRSAIMELVPHATRWFGTEPRLLVFEDLHWCDAASMDLLLATAAAVQDLPSLLLFAFRPDPLAESRRLDGWLLGQPRDRTDRISLAPLSADDGGVLVDALLPSGADREVRAQILRRTEGNPLFVEELVAGVLADPAHGAIPDTLQALITARLDALDEETRRTLQLASVIGRSFTEPILGAVARDGAGLRARLDALMRARLISAVSDEPEQTFAFHHSLTQEAAYATILRRDRRELHRRVGVSLAARYADRLDEFAPVVAHHFEAAQDDPETLRYATIAGDNASRLYANADAVAHYDAAIEAASRLTDRDALLGHLYPSRGRALELSGRFDDAVANYEGMQAAAEHLGDRRAELEAAMALTTLYSTPTPKFDLVESGAAARRAVALAEALGDPAAEAKAWWNVMNAHVFGGGDIDEAREAGERSLALARTAGAEEQLAFTLTDLWRPYAALGRLDDARRVLEEGRALWRARENLPMLSENLASESGLLRILGDDDAALALADEAGAIADRIGNLWGRAYAAINAFGIAWDRGEAGAAIASMIENVELAEQAGFVAPLATTRSTLAGAYAYLGDLDRARALAQLALEIATDRLPSARPWAFAVIAEIHLTAGELAEVSEALDAADTDILPEPLRSAASFHLPLLRGRAFLVSGDRDHAVETADAVLDRLRHAGIRPFEAEALLLRGRAIADAREAARTLERAEEVARELGHRRVLWEVLAALADVSERSAPGRRAEARSIVEQIAASVDDGLRATFLARPDVRAVLA